VTVPASAWGWEEVLKRFGKLTFKEVLQPAIDYAENGFPVSQRIANDWRLPNAIPLTACCNSVSDRSGLDRRCARRHDGPLGGRRRRQYGVVG
jgi:gamma-glutamyltranspeptidase/glutathione hydrolase